MVGVGKHPLAVLLIRIKGQPYILVLHQRTHNFLLAFLHFFSFRRHLLQVAFLLLGHSDGFFEEVLESLNRIGIIVYFGGLRVTINLKIKSVFLKHL